MQNKTADVVIIGAGLTGLTLAYYLKQLDVSLLIIEARDRIGGRIYTKQNANQAPLELGATWLVNEHRELLNLIKTLDLEVFEQFYGTTAIYEPNTENPAQLVKLPQNNHSSYRIKNGTQSMIKALSETLDSNQIITNCEISEIAEHTGNITATSKSFEFTCKHIVSTLPPQLFENTINVKPELPPSVKEIMKNTHTWMHDSIKVGFTFANPFWKNISTSGTIYSNVSVLQEFYDHSSADNTKHALVGFMNKELNHYTKAQRKDLALKQLERYYGSHIHDYLSYEELAWKNETFTTAVNNSYIMPQRNNGHPVFQEAYLNNTLFIAGTETSEFAPGKMEGAIRSAQRVFNQIKSLL
ncbi:flavin monoamine oxidase family protein [Psychroserpens damuponensis]|uniref:flavin monoamine oxidase family protein n=1 Tax=Psychroserpens damuponensis TaxID=943936 RepID=UPI00058F7E1D|nr:NAD(P)/FAD-dependent oxidoreductase [Psychroserpens damuponensis]